MTPGSRTAEPDTAFRPLRILVAEDTEINQVILQDVLNEQGHELAFANNGAQALELAGRNTFDLILMDIQMPVIGGIEATLRIRLLPAPYGAVPIIALTASNDASEQRRYLDAGMNGCLAKPFDWDRIDAALARYAGGKVSTTAEANARPDRAPEAVVDVELLDRLRRKAGPAQVRDMVQNGMAAYACYVDAMVKPGTSHARIRSEAHKLKGSAGTLGFRGISALAAQIENAHDDDPAIPALLRGLKEMLAATRGELTSLGFCW